MEGYSDALDGQEREVKAKLEITLHYEKLFWKENARVKCHAEGDRNTKIFTW